MTELTTPFVMNDLFGPAPHLDRLSWQPWRPGVEIVHLYNSAPGAAAALLRYAPGASVPRHRHAGYEHILILAGSQHDERGVYPVGTLLISPPQSHHAVASGQGCIVLAIWEKPVEFMEET